MKPDKEIEMIEHMLKQLTPPDQTVHQRMCWERGFLTGFLARLAKADSGIKAAIIQRTRQH